MQVSRAKLAGVVAVGAYLAALLATGLVSAHRTRPLFEGFAPPPRYQWVHPPPAFAAGNEKPKAGDNTLSLTDTGTVQTGVASDDAQLLLNLPAGAVAPLATATSVLSHITPIDPQTLGPVPAGMRPDGNAYRVELTYQPNGPAITTLAKPATMVLTVPDPTSTLLYASDGKSWTTLPSVQAGAAGLVGASFDKTGWFLAAEPAASTPRSFPFASRWLSIAFWAVLTAVILLVLVAVARHRRKPAAPPGRPTPRAAATRPPAGSTKDRRGRGSRKQ